MRKKKQHTTTTTSIIETNNSFRLLSYSFLCSLFSFAVSASHSKCPFTLGCCFWLSSCVSAPFVPFDCYYLLAAYNKWFWLWIILFFSVLVTSTSFASSRLVSQEEKRWKRKTQNPGQQHSLNEMFELDFVVDEALSRNSHSWSRQKKIGFLFIIIFGLLRIRIDQEIFWATNTRQNFSANFLYCVDLSVCVTFRHFMWQDKYSDIHNKSDEGGIEWHSVFFPQVL